MFRGRQFVFVYLLDNIFRHRLRINLGKHKIQINSCVPCGTGCHVRVIINQINVQALTESTFLGEVPILVTRRDTVKGAQKSISFFVSGAEPKVCCVICLSLALITRQQQQQRKAEINQLSV